jgi:hypothetical protein
MDMCRNFRSDRFEARYSNGSKFAGKALSVRYIHQADAGRSVPDKREPMPWSVWNKYRSVPNCRCTQYNAPPEFTDVADDNLKRDLWAIRFLGFAYMKIRHSSSKKRR